MKKITSSTEEINMLKEHSQWEQGDSHQYYPFMEDKSIEKADVKYGNSNDRYYHHYGYYF